MQKTKYYIIFPSHIEGMKLNSLLKKNSVKNTIVPTPRELSKSCGICMTYEKKDEKYIKELIKNNNVKIIGMKSLTKEHKNYYI